MNLSAIPNTSFVGRLLRFPLRLIPSEARVPILQGPLRGKSWIVGSGTHGCWLGSYEQQKSILFERTVIDGTTVFDVGANVGFYTLLASVLVGALGQVVAFEPVPRNLRYLREHVRRNRLTNVTVIEAAVSDRSGRATFSEGPNPSEGRLAEDGSLTVDTVSIDELVETNAIPPPHCIKIDVEGAEGLVLAGARGVLVQWQPTLFLATHGRVVHETCVELLTSLGYALEAIDGPSIDRCSELLAQPTRRDAVGM